MVFGEPNLSHFEILSAFWLTQQRYLRGKVGHIAGWQATLGYGDIGRRLAQIGSPPPLEGEPLKHGLLEMPNTAGRDLSTTARLIARFKKQSRQGRESKAASFFDYDPNRIATSSTNFRPWLRSGSSIQPSKFHHEILQVHQPSAKPLPKLPLFWFCHLYVERPTSGLALVITIAIRRSGAYSGFCRATILRCFFKTMLSP